jgi:hypothetical protein
LEEIETVIVDVYEEDTSWKIGQSRSCLWDSTRDREKIRGMFRETLFGCPGGFNFREAPLKYQPIDYFINISPKDINI